MPETNAEGLNIAATVETVQGAFPPPAVGWLNLEADAVGDPGPQYKKDARRPFTITRQLRRPFVSGLDAALSLSLDATKDHLDFFAEGMVKSVFKHSGGTGVSQFRPTAVTATGYTVAASGNLANSMLAVARGFGIAGNNGLKLLAGGSIAAEIRTPGLTAEAAPPANAQVEVCGYQASVAADIQLDANGDLIATALNFTTLGLNVGQWIYIPNAAEALVMGSANFAFANVAYTGFACIKAIAAGKLSLERRSWVVGAADLAAGKTIRIFFTKWVRNVARSHADERLISYAFEVAYPGLAPGPAPAYEYPLGYMLDEATFMMSPEDKVSLQLTFIGKTTKDPVAARQPGPATALDPVTSLAVSTSSDITRLSVNNVDETGLMTDFQDLKLVLKNNIGSEKALGTMGNRFTPLGSFEAQTTSKVYFTDLNIIAAVRDNRILRLGAGARNTDFGMILDVPSVGLMKAPQGIEHNKLITLNTDIAGFMDATTKYTAGISMFAYLPVA